MAYNIDFMISVTGGFISFICPLITCFQVFTMDFPSISWSFSVSGSFTGSWGFINSPSFSGAPGRRSGVSRGAVEENMDELICIYIYYFNIDIYIYKYYYVYMICFLLSYIYDTLLDIWNNMMIFYDAIWSDTDMMIEFLSDNSDKSPLGGGEGTAYVHLTQCQKGMAPGQRISWPECIPWGKLT